jgi:outer membrane lipoprotein-sorting protein
LRVSRRVVYAGAVSARLAVLVLACEVLASLAWGGTAREILDRRKALDDTTRHWEDRHQKMKLTIVDRRGSERVREIDVFDRREPDDEQKTILFFLAPAEVKGTGFLAFTHKSRAADQWLYLPELQRVRQITARTRNESFMGTDLSYHDLDLIQEMTSWTEADARSSLRPEETVDGTPTHVIELVPQREDIGYKRIVLWLGRDDLVPRKLELFEDRAEPKKRIVQGDVRTVGAIPVAHRIDAATPDEGSHTAITIADVQFDQKLDPDLFTQRALERGGH